MVIKIKRSQVGISSKKVAFFVIFKEVVRFIIKAHYCPVKVD